MVWDAHRIRSDALIWGMSKLMISSPGTELRRHSSGADQEPLGPSRARFETWRPDWRIAFSSEAFSVQQH